MNKITGEYDPQEWWGVVRFDGAVLSPRYSQQFYNHSPTGFAWGYGGSGPAQLALAILLRAGVPSERAVQLYQRFKAQHIANLPVHAPFTLEVDVLEWAAAQEVP